eukprot:1467575-Ditylum_brightwellii.AAC.1
MEVQLYHISNDDLYEEFGIDPLETIMISCQLHWIGKIACIDEKHLPRKFLTAWHIYPRPIGVLEELDKDRKISDWMPKIQEDPKDWDIFCTSIMPNMIGRKN